jgi:GDP-D-mannose dehydratase
MKALIFGISGQNGVYLSQFLLNKKVIKYLALQKIQKQIT